jgi:hypothetical protein
MTHIWDDFLEKNYLVCFVSYMLNILMYYFEGMHVILYFFLGGVTETGACVQSIRRVSMVLVV